MGMEQRTIGRLFFAETLIMGGVSLVLGIGPRGPPPPVHHGHADDPPLRVALPARLDFVPRHDPVGGGLFPAQFSGGGGGCPTPGPSVGCRSWICLRPAVKTKRRSTKAASAVLALKQLGFWFELPVGSAVVVSTASAACFVAALQNEISAYIGYGVLAVQLRITTAGSGSSAGMLLRQPPGRCSAGC